MPAPKVAIRGVLPETRSALISSLLAVSYATWVPLTNRGLTAAGSNLHRFLALAGSWMSRTTMVGSPLRAPSTRLSPAGTAAGQLTNNEAPAVEPGLEDA